MKILTISDNVLRQLENEANLNRQYGDADAIISCGDLPAYYLEYIGAALNKPVFYVRGNHDVQYDEQPPGGENLHKRVVRFQGLTFAGLEGCIRYNREPIQYTEGQMYSMVWALWWRLWLQRLRRGYGVDVLVTHSPPRGIHDLKDPAHRGFQALRFALRLFKPRYMLHGHIDTQDVRIPKQTTFGNTEIININPVKYLTIEPKAAASPHSSS